MKTTLRTIVVVTAAAIFFLGAAAFFFLKQAHRGGQQQPSPVAQERVSTLGTVDLRGKGFAALKEYFEGVAKDKGGRVAFDQMRTAVTDGNVDMHLLGHAVGDILYKQEGVEGMTACNNDFRNACSHSIVVGLFGDFGEGAIPMINDVCKKAPGGPGAYTMCFHGLGHGVLSYYGYSMEKASAVCQKFVNGNGSAESDQCISGAVMEIVGGGFHDRAIWEKSRAKTLDPKAPTALCQQPYLPDSSRGLCYTYLTPYLWEAAGYRQGTPFTDEMFEASFAFCKDVKDARNRDTCYGGFGKEFDGLALARDIRQSALSKIGDEQFAQIHHWCSLSGGGYGERSCVLNAMASLYWGGENDRSIARRFCESAPSRDLREQCTEALIGAVDSYIPDHTYREDFCRELTGDQQVRCTQRLLKVSS